MNFQTAQSSLETFRTEDLQNRCSLKVTLTWKKPYRILFLHKIAPPRHTILQKNSREYIAIETEDRNVVTKNDKEIVLWVRRSGCNMLSNYEHALEPFKKLLRHTVKPSNIPGRKKSSKQIKKRNNISNTLKSPQFPILSKFLYKSKTAKQFV